MRPLSARSYQVTADPSGARRWSSLGDRQFAKKTLMVLRFLGQADREDLTTLYSRSTFSLRCIPML